MRSGTLVTQADTIDNIEALGVLPCTTYGRSLIKKNINLKKHIRSFSSDIGRSLGIQCVRPPHFHLLTSSFLVVKILHKRQTTHLDTSDSP